MKVKDIMPTAQSYKVDSNLFYVCGSRDTIIKDRETLDLIIDIPCLEACRYLFDCNILTCCSSANVNDLSSGYGYITIKYESLNEFNKKIFLSLQEHGLIKDSKIFVPINENTTVEEFSEKMLKIAKLFRPQEILYGFYTIDEMCELISDSSRVLDYLYEKLLKKEIPTDDNGEVSFEGFKISKLVLCDAFVEFCNNDYGGDHYYYDDEKKVYWINEELFKKSKMQSFNR